LFVAGIEKVELMNKTFVKYDWQKVKKFGVTYLERLGFTPENADIILDVLLVADLRGKRSHGILRLPHYNERYLNKTINIRPKMQFKEVAGASAILDADDAAGQIAGVLAVDKAIEIAKTQGVGIVPVIRSSHNGIAGYYSDRAANQNMIGIAMSHTDANTVPFGAAEPYLGTNAIAFSAPTDGVHPLSIDFCTSKISFGKLYDAQVNGVTLPSRSAMDSNGNYTTDPDQAEYMVSAAEHKGYGLGLMVEVLCAHLTGLPFAKHITDMYKEIDKPRNLGQFYLAIDIAKFIPPAIFRKNIQRMIDDLRNLRTDVNHDQMIVHGEQSYNNQQRYKKEGIPLEEALVVELTAMAAGHGIDFPKAIDES
jgi:ureidoglycolate dehydrogenase (NAD+)